MEIRNLAPSSVTGQTSKTKTRHENVTTIRRIALIGHRREELPSQRVEGGKKKRNKVFFFFFLRTAEEREGQSRFLSATRNPHTAAEHNTLSQKNTKKFTSEFQSNFHCRTSSMATNLLVVAVPRFYSFFFSRSSY